MDEFAWAPALTAIRDTDAAVPVADDGQLSVRIKLLDRLGGLGDLRN